MWLGDLVKVLVFLVYTIDTSQVRKKLGFQNITVFIECCQYINRNHFYQEHFSVLFIPFCIVKLAVFH